jgi:hypothetical protein
MLPNDLRFFNSIYKQQQDEQEIRIGNSKNLKQFPFQRKQYADSEKHS